MFESKHMLCARSNGCAHKAFELQGRFPSIYVDEGQSPLKETLILNIIIAPSVVRDYETLFSKIMFHNLFTFGEL